MSKNPFPIGTILVYLQQSGFYYIESCGIISFVEQYLSCGNESFLAEEREHISFIIAERIEKFHRIKKRHIIETTYRIKYFLHNNKNTGKRKLFCSGETCRYRKQDDRKAVDYHVISSIPHCFRYSLVAENGRLPKNPLWAENGDGCGEAMIKCFVLSMSDCLEMAYFPQRMNTRCFRSRERVRMTSSVNASHHFS